MLIQPQSSHWYQWVSNHFEPFYEVDRADGKGKRRTTLADARKAGAVPSMTNVIGILAKPQLEAWKMEQAILASLTLPRLPEEPLDSYARRVVEDADGQSEKARQFGTDLHRAIEEELLVIQSKGQLFSVSTELDIFLTPVRQWLNENVVKVYATECIVGDRSVGIAGKLDLDCELKGIGRALVDFKTQSVKKGKVVFYPEWPIQLAGYEHCRNSELGGMPEMAIASVVIDSITPGGIYVNMWSDTEIYWELFEHAFELWRYLKDYDPRKSNG